MKQRILLPVVFCVSMAFGAYGQKGVEIGANAIFNGSFIIHQNLFQTLNGTGIPQQSRMAYRFTFGYNVGLVVGYNFNEKYGIVTSLCYNSGGEHYDDTFNPAASVPLHIVRKIDLGYLQLPILFKYTFVSFKQRYRLYLMTGPELGFLIKSQEGISINNVSKTDVIPASYEYNTVDLGWAFGTGTDIYIRQDLYFEGGIFGYISMLDINSSTVKNQPWFANNNVKYQKSYNFNPGIEIGIHFLFNKDAHNPFQKKATPGTKEK